MPDVFQQGGVVVAENLAVETWTPLPEVLARGPVDLPTLVDWGIKIAGMLAAAHRTGVAHGDLRVATVLIGADGEIALARPTAGDADPVDHAAQPCRAPEMAGGGGPTPMADIWALGALLHAAGGGGEPALAGLWPWLGCADPALRPSAPEVAAKLRELARPGARSESAATLGSAPGGFLAAATELPVVPANPWPSSPPADPTLGPDPRGPRYSAQASSARPGRARGELVAAVVGVLAVVSGLIGGVWLVVAPPQPGRAVAADPIGDVRTADPCSVLDQGPLQRFGGTRLVPDTDVPAGCSIDVVQIGHPRDLGIGVLERTVSRTTRPCTRCPRSSKGR